MESLESKIVHCAHDLAEALKDFAYTRKDEDKKRVNQLQMDLIRIFEDAKPKQPPIQ